MSASARASAESNVTLTAITANRLSDGAVVYLAPGGAWRESLACCRLAETDEERQAMEDIARWAVHGNIVVAPYAIDVVVEPGGGPRPARLREAIRAVGPTVRADLARPMT